MMLTMVLALIAQASPVPPSDILVIGQRLKRARLVTRADRQTGARRCLVRRSSGDPALDGALCEATLVCARTAVKEPEMVACMRPQVAAIMTRFAAGPARTDGPVDR